MGGDEGKQFMLFPGQMQMRQGSTAAHAYSMPGFPPQVHLPTLPGAYPPPPFPGAYTYASPGYTYAHAHAFAYPPPPPPPGPYAYPPQGYPHPGSPTLPHQQGHGSSGHGGGGRQWEVMESTPKAGSRAAHASATATYGGNSHGSSGHGGGRQIEMTPKAAGGTTAATASAMASYGAISNLGQGISRNNGAFGHGKFRAKCTTWK